MKRWSQRLRLDLIVAVSLAVLLFGSVIFLTSSVEASPQAVGANTAQHIAGAITDSKGRPGPCTNNHDITVVVDFHELKDGLLVRCAKGPVPGQNYTGFDALTEAGITFRTTVRHPGFVCRIQDLPSTDPCIDASPAHAYWSYWLAPRGGTWCYSNWGAGNRIVPPGSVEGWSFSFNKTASTSPPPRYGAPDPLPGTAPQQLKGDDCDPSGSTPPPSSTPTTTTIPRTTPTPPTQVPTPSTTAPTPPPSWPVVPESPMADSGTPDSHPDATPSGSDVTGNVDEESGAASALGETTTEYDNDLRNGSEIDVEAGEEFIQMSNDHDDLAFLDTSDFDIKEPASPIGAIMVAIILTLLGLGGYAMMRRRRQTDTRILTPEADQQ